MAILRVGRMRSALLSLFLMPTFGGCALVDESVTLRPTTQVSASAVGHGQRVGLNVVDERTTTIIGFRGPLRTAEITTAQDVRQVVNDAVAQGLRNLGFDPIAHTGAVPVTLVVQIRELSYEATSGFLTGGIYTRAALKAIARRNQDSFEELYRVEEEERTVVVPTEASDAERINLALSHAIDKMFTDQRLLDFLAAAASNSTSIPTPEPDAPISNLSPTINPVVTSPTPPAELINAPNATWHDGTWTAETPNWSILVVLVGDRFEGNAHCRPANQHYRISGTITGDGAVDGSGSPIRATFEYGSIDIGGHWPNLAMPVRVGCTESSLTLTPY
ncbi:MAG: YajG family lipoprotein [Dongiaceae bacterium]